MLRSGFTNGQAVYSTDAYPMLKEISMTTDAVAHADIRSVDKAVVRYVVCAAIRAADGSLLLGIRHYSADMRAQIDARRDGGKFMHRHDEDQGFVDQFGVWMSREEAFKVAFDSEQLRYPDRCGTGLNGMKLYSEGLY